MVPALLKFHFTFLCQFESDLSLKRLNKILNKSSNGELLVICIIFKSFLKTPPNERLKKIKLNDRARNFFKKHPKKYTYFCNTFSDIANLRNSKEKKLKALKVFKTGLLDILSVLFNKHGES